MSYETGCRRKRRYSKHEAKIVLKRLQTATGTHDLNVYRCVYCNWHHVGHDGHKRYKRLRKAFVRA